MTLRANGSYIGPRDSAVSTTAASGVWDLRTAQRYQAEAAWPVPFAPNAISGLQLWLDAADSSTLYDATTGGSLVAADGTVKRWEDKSGNDRHATEGTNGPQRKTAIQGGKDVLRFDGSNDFLSIPSSTATFTFLHDGDSTIFAVYKWTNPAADPKRRVLFSTALNNESIVGTTGTAFWMRNDFGDTAPFSKMQMLAVSTGGTRINSYTNDNSYPVDTFHVVTVSADPENAVNESRAVFRKSGIVQTDTAASATASLPTGNATYDLHICTQAGPTNRLFAQCDLCELILYDSLLSDTDRQAVENYLLAKWGIA